MASAYRSSEGEVVVRARPDPAIAQGTIAVELPPTSITTVVTPLARSPGAN
jgi:hypothetical protein